ncbi:c-type cytochrome [Roseicitreum antarcticum]|uniref:Cytochrome c n=1 Tax=Roseicitreum antarcticum TaxID=564137 RepID=A0A1H2X4H5_9RHOB|nr:c-type cytochrome [Roseicitreum antarcticum]SDW87691.1 cytochrome c [Roseicitreum antarcticum]
MFDTMVFTKALAALCGALLVFLVGAWIANALYVPLNADAPAAYAIDTGTDEADTDAEPVAEVPFEELYASADPAAGSRVWNQCRACHALEAGRNGVGPYLHGVVGRPIGTAEGYGNYSGALAQVGEAWTPELISHFIENPRGVAPGTSMSYSGLGSAEDRANLIAYIEQESQ